MLWVLKIAKRCGTKWFPHVIGTAASGWQKAQKTTLVSMCYHALSLIDSKRKCGTKWFSHVIGLVASGWQKAQKTTLVSACYHALSLTDSKRKCGTKWFSHVIRTAASGWQKAQKTTLVPACYHALSLTDSKKFIRIAARVFLLVAWLHGQYDRDCGAADKSEALAPMYPQWGTQTYVVLDNLWD